jgi:hypothetical protein
MFDIFCDWVQHSTLGAHGGEFDIRFKIGEPCENRSARLEIDSHDSVGELVVWTSGDYIAEIIDIGTEQSKYRTSGVLSSGQQLEEVFRVFFETLGFRLQA